MSTTFQKTLIVTLLSLTGIFHGWPLLVAATCSMPEPLTMSQTNACCCCEDREDTVLPGFSSCSPGETVVGILGTDHSLLPEKDKIKKWNFSSTVAYDFEPEILWISPTSCSGVWMAQPLLLHTNSPPIYLLDGVFRI